MPYIPESRREDLDFRSYPETVGELNFAITQMIIDFLGDNPRYADYNGVIGVLACAQQEIYRRAVAPYEEKAAKQNGDLKWPLL